MFWVRSPSAGDKRYSLGEFILGMERTQMILSYWCWLENSWLTMCLCYILLLFRKSNTSCHSWWLQWFNVIETYFSFMYAKVGKIPILDSLPLNVNQGSRLYPFSSFATRWMNWVREDMEDCGRIQAADICFD